MPEAEARIRVDRGEFMECYARLMMRFAKLTPHQREKLEEVRAAKVVVARTRGRWEDVRRDPARCGGAE